MAKKALSEALSPENKPSSTFSASSISNPSNKNSTTCSFSSNSATKQPQSSCYASSADNIARLLKGWMKNNPPKLFSRTNSAVTQNSIFNNLGTDTASSDEGSPSGALKGGAAEVLSETFESLFGFEYSLDQSNSNSDQFSQSLSPEASTTVLQDESKPDINIGAEIMPFSLLEKWLLDEAAGC